MILQTSQAGRGSLRDCGLRLAFLYYLAANLAGLVRVAVPSVAPTAASCGSTTTSRA